MVLPPVLASVVDWLRTGYPNGMPERGYVPLFALLRRRLGDDEIADIARALQNDRATPVASTDIAVIITTITDEIPNSGDVARVQQHLAEAGWPRCADPPCPE